MVIKEHYKSLKNLHKAEGLMLLEAVALLGFVVLVGCAASTLHGLIMMSYRSTENRMQALSYAENKLASALTGVPYQARVESAGAPVNAHGMVTPQKNTLFSKQNSLFKSEITKTRGVPFLPAHKPFTIVTATVTWRERDQENNVILTRLVPDEWIGT